MSGTAAMKTIREVHRGYLDHKFVSYLVRPLEMHPKTAMNVTDDKFLGQQISPICYEPAASLCSQGSLKSRSSNQSIAEFGSDMVNVASSTVTPPLPGTCLA
jgi:hypothetical protein